MGLSTLTSLLLALLATQSQTLARPTSQDMSSRDQPFSSAQPALTGIYICTDANWAGDCRHIIQASYTCRDLNKEFGPTITSFGPDWGTDCLVFKSKDCSHADFLPMEVTYPGMANVGELWNDKILSIECHYTGA